MGFSILWCHQSSIVCPHSAALIPTSTILVRVMAKAMTERKVMMILSLRDKPRRRFGVVPFQLVWNGSWGIPGIGVWLLLGRVTCPLVGMDVSGIMTGPARVLSIVVVGGR